MIDDMHGRSPWDTHLALTEKWKAAYVEGVRESEFTTKDSGDPVEMPSHYTQLPVECIDITEHFSFTLGNAIKYIWRADHKGKPVEDLRKAVWYLEREIKRRGRE